MSMRLSLMAVCLMLVTACTSVENFGQSLGDKSSRFFSSRYVGEDYASLAAKRDWTFERNPILGQRVGREALSNNNVIYFHEIRQESQGSGITLFDTVSLGDKAVRYDYYAYLVAPNGKIIDFAHKRSNAKISSFGIDGGFIGLELDGKEKGNKTLTPVADFVTSSGEGLQSWR